MQIRPNRRRSPLRSTWRGSPARRRDPGTGRPHRIWPGLARTLRRRRRRSRPSSTSSRPRRRRLRIEALRRIVDQEGGNRSHRDIRSAPRRKRGNRPRRSRRRSRRVRRKRVRSLARPSRASIPWHTWGSPAEVPASWILSRSGIVKMLAEKKESFTRLVVVDRAVDFVLASAAVLDPVAHLIRANGSAGQRAEEAGVLWTRQAYKSVVDERTESTKGFFFASRPSPRSSSGQSRSSSPPRQSLRPSHLARAQTRRPSRHRSTRPSGQRLKSERGRNPRHETKSSTRTNGLENVFFSFPIFPFSTQRDKLQTSPLIDSYGREKKLREHILGRLWACFVEAMGED